MPICCYEKATFYGYREYLRDLRVTGSGGGCCGASLRVTTVTYAAKLFNIDMKATDTNITTTSTATNNMIYVQNKIDA